MSDFKLDKNGASALEQRQLQTLINMVKPDTLKVDGAFGPKSREALESVLEEHGINVEDGMTLQDAIEVMKDVAREHAPPVDVSNDPISRELNGDALKRVQNLINIINPDLMSKRQMDGLFGNQTLGAIQELLPDADLKTMSMNEIITALEEQVVNLPERYIVDDCDNLTVIARERMGDLIDQHVTDLMASGDPKYATEKAARIHAEQVAVTAIVFAEGNEHHNLGEGDNAHIINPDDIIAIPDLDSLKDVDGSLDWGALDAAVGPGGPCLPCLGLTAQTPVAPVFSANTAPGSPIRQLPNYTPAPHLPNQVRLGPDCLATLNGEGRRHGIFGGPVQPRYSIRGEGGENVHDLRRILGRDDVTSVGSCPRPHDGGEGNPNGPGGGNKGGGFS